MQHQHTLSTPTPAPSPVQTCPFSFSSKQNPQPISHTVKTTAISLTCTWKQGTYIWRHKSTIKTQHTSLKEPRSSKFCRQLKLKKERSTKKKINVLALFMIWWIRNLLPMKQESPSYWVCVKLKLCGWVEPKVDEFKFKGKRNKGFNKKNGAEIEREMKNKGFDLTWWCERRRRENSKRENTWWWWWWWEEIQDWEETVLRFERGLVISGFDWRVLRTLII